MSGLSIVGGAFYSGFNWGATGRVYVALCLSVNDGEDEAHSKVASAAGTYSRLSLNATNQNGVITGHFRKNGADGNGVVATTSSGTGWFTDVTNSDALADGDFTAISMSASGSFTELAQMIAQFSATSGNATWYFGRGSSSSGNNGGNYYCSMQGGSPDGTSAGGGVKMTHGGTVSHGTTWQTNGFQTFTDVINASNGAISVVGVAGTWVQDAIHSDTFSGGDVVGMHTGATGTERTYNEGLRCVTSTDFQEFQGYAGDNGNWNATGYASLIGGDPNGRVEAAAQIKMPFGGMKLQSWRFYQYAVGTGPFTFKSRVNGSTGNASVSASSGSTGLFTDVTNSDSVSQGDLVCGQGSLPSGGAANVGWVGASMVPGSSTETSTGVLAYGPLAFNAKTYEPGAGLLSYSGLAFTAHTRSEDARGAMAFGALAMAGAATVPQHLTSTGVLAFGGLVFQGTSGIEISASTFAFSGISFVAGGGSRASQAAVLALAEVIPTGRASELAVLALAEPPPPPSRASELAVLALGVVIPGNRMSQLAFMALVGAEPCSTQRADIWIITRKDGVVLGFTSHDSDLTFNGVLCHACGSLSAGATEQTSDLATTGSITLNGIISSPLVSDEDLYAGSYDDAFIEVWRTSWGAPETPVRVAAGWAGNVESGEAGWQVDVLGPGTKMGQQAITEVITPTCRWVFGSPQCGVDLTTFQQAGVVLLSPDRSTIFMSIADPHLDAQWNNGSILLTSGRNAGTIIETKTVEFAAGSSRGTILTWLPVPFPLSPGDTFELRPGCDKTVGACQLYDNFLNFGGFPDVPGTDSIIQLPTSNY
jgi:uncharacterized phage protein (TIGR02218 family)